MFLQFLDEMAIAKKGQFNQFVDDDLIFDGSEMFIKKDNDFKEFKKLGNFVIFFDEGTFKKRKELGIKTEEELYFLCSPFKDCYKVEYGFCLQKINYKHNYKKPLRLVQGIAKIKSSNLKGLALDFYKAMCEKFTILSDDTQYDNARKLWLRLSKETGVRVDVVDVSSGVINVLETNYILSSENDKKIWGSKVSKDIRLTLYS